MFGTPIAGADPRPALFVGSILYDVLLPSFIAGVTAYQVSAALGITYFNHPVPFVPVFSEGFFFTVVVAGLFFGLCSFVMVESMNLGKKVADRLPTSPYVNAVVGGSTLAAMSVVIGPRFLGLGLDGIESALRGGAVPWYAFPVKAAAFTSRHPQLRRSGGIVSPSSSSAQHRGPSLPQTFGLHAPTFAALGLVGVLAGAANTPASGSDHGTGDVRPVARPLRRRRVRDQLSHDRPPQRLPVTGARDDQVALDRGERRRAGRRGSTRNSTPRGS